MQSIHPRCNSSRNILLVSQILLFHLLPPELIPAEWLPASKLCSGDRATCSGILINTSEKIVNFSKLLQTTKYVLLLFTSVRDKKCRKELQRLQEKGLIESYQTSNKPLDIAIARAIRTQDSRRIPQHLEDNQMCLENDGCGF